MKTRHVVRGGFEAGSSDPNTTLVPSASGFHRIRAEGGAADARPDGTESEEPLTVRSSRATLGPLSLDTVRSFSQIFALSLLAAAIITLRLFAQSELEVCLVSFAPLVFIALESGKTRAYVQAGLAALVLAALDAFARVPSNATTRFGLTEPHRLVLAISAAIAMVRLYGAYRRSQELSRRDALTGLLNRRAFEQLAETELARAARYGRTLAFALIDLDRFKQINDQFGHARGDSVLRIVGEELARLRASDFAFRLGGDEFALLMPEIDETGARHVVSRLKERVHERMRAQGLQLTLSVGVATSGRQWQPVASLMAEADRRMYENKPRHASER